jgi:acyl dehydratase
VTISQIADVQYGEELPACEPDTSMDTVREFANTVGWGGGRFTDHEAARKEGFPGAVVPGVMSQGWLAAMIHNWAPDATIRSIDTVFRAPVLVDEPHQINGVVTDINTDDAQVEIDLTVTNSKGETRVFGTALLGIPKG